MNTTSFAAIRGKPRIFALAAAICCVGVAGAIRAAPINTNAPATVAHTTRLHPGDVLTGTLPMSQPIHVEVALKIRNRSELYQFIANAAKDSLKGTQRPMSSDQFTANHAPTQLQALTVASYLALEGFRNVVIAPNRMLVSADGTADSARRAFLTSFAQVRTHDGRTAFANTDDAHVPLALKDIVLSVVGLQTVHQAHVFAQRLDPKLKTSATGGITGHNPNEFSSIYGGTGVATAAGVAIGIISEGNITQTITDLNTFTTSNGLAAVNTQRIDTNGTSTDTSNLAEWSLDSQDVVGMAGGQVGQIIFYNIPTLLNTDLTADINTVVAANAVKIINVSLGECELNAQADGSAAATDQIFAVAVAQGQTFSISTGDSGADECGNGGTTPSWPAASQYAIAVAGTTLNASSTTWSSETVWHSSGGSQSTFEPKPNWQTLWSGPYRGVSDIAFDADPSSGSKIIVNGVVQQWGGTSLSAPIFAGMWARVIAVKGQAVGFAGPLVYNLPATDFHDITSGYNGISAGVGYDLASGRGSFILSQAINHIGTAGDTPPVANFSFTTSGLTVNFTDSSTDSSGTIASRVWNFGDGSTSTSTNPSYAFAVGGTYSVAETVTDNLGATNTKIAAVTVTGGPGGNVLSNGVAVTNLAATAGNQILFTMYAPPGVGNLTFGTSGGLGDVDLYVKFGSAPTLSTFDCRSYTPTTTETCKFAKPQTGTYYVMLYSYASFTGVSLLGSYSPSAPVANFSIATSGLLASLTDHSTDTNGTISSYAWTFGDGVTSTATNPSHTYAAVGTYSVTEKVTDNFGATSNKTSSVTVNNSTIPGELIGNTGFETGAAAPWVASRSGMISNSPSEPAHSGRWDAWLDGLGSARTDTLSQQVAIPAGITSATLSFYLHVDTAETGANGSDKLRVQVFSTSGSLMGTLAIYTNLNKAPGYVLHSLSMNQYIGKTVVLKFTGTENATLQTSFVLDDITLNVQ